MSEMKLIMESWRRFRLSEEGATGPKFKENPQDTIALLKALSTERDEQRVQKVLQQILADKDVAEVLEALGEMFQEVTGEEEAEVDMDEGLDDLGRSVAGFGLDIAAKTEEFLKKTPAGNLLRKTAPALLGLSIAAMMLNGGQITPGALKTVSKLITGSVTPETLAAAVADVGLEALEALQERKKN